ncbi:MAG: cache domain-containing protein, partial [Lachnospiraceae bacterium]|nr:cache domain-containing protein [Lachnospiraceae bacterium]
MKRKKLLQEVVVALFLLLIVMISFHWYTTRNRERIEQRNKNYAADAARMKADQIDNELNNALNIISTYAYFVGESLDEPVITAKMLEKMEEKVVFDSVMFTDMNGTDYISDGRTADVKQRNFFKEGIKGSTGIEIVFEPYFFDETMACFYTPVYYEDEMIGVLRGAYLAEKYLQDMLVTTYFGEDADVFLCTPDGMVIASSNSHEYHDHIHEGYLVDFLEQRNVIDKDTALKVKGVFENGGSGVFVCNQQSKTDNICVTYLPHNGYVLVQTFPKQVTQSMVKAENLIGLQLESILIILFVIYIISLFVRAGHEKKLLERENREMGYIIDGVNTLFTRFALVDFEEGTYQYLAGTTPEDSNIAAGGSYKELTEYLSSILINEDERLEFARQIGSDMLIEALAKHNDVRFECYVLRDGKPEWEHVNIICLERKDGKASKVLFTRQNITEIKQKELSIQAEMALADRKERQYRIAITSNALNTFEFNLTKDLLEQDIVCEINGNKISLLERVGLEAPCKASECFEKWKSFILEESMEDYCKMVNTDYLKACFEKGIPQVDVDYWGQIDEDEQMCIRQSFIMTRENDTNDIIVMVVSKEITEQVRKQR